MAARDQQGAAEEEEREDIAGDDLPDQHVQTPDDPPDVSDESAFLDLNGFAAELNCVLEDHNEDDFD